MDSTQLQQHKINSERLKSESNTAREIERSGQDNSFDESKNNKDLPQSLNVDKVGVGEKLQSVNQSLQQWPLSKQDVLSVASKNQEEQINEPSKNNISSNENSKLPELKQNTSVKSGSLNAKMDNSITGGKESIGENQKVDDEENKQKQDETQENLVKRPKWQIKGEKILDNYIITSLMSAITVYSLFFDDIRMIALTTHTDDIIFGITTFCFCAFAVEIICASIVKEKYFLTFFFWLDVVSTLSMITDIGWIMDLMTGGGGSGQAGNAAQLAKTSRAGRVTRVIRVIRLIRLIRIVKLYKQAKLAQQKQEEKLKEEQKQKEALERARHRTSRVSRMATNFQNPNSSQNINLSQERFKTININEDRSGPNNNSKQLAVINENVQEERKYEDSLDQDFNKVDRKNLPEQQSNSISQPNIKVTLQQKSQDDSQKKSINQINNDTPIVNQGDQSTFKKSVIQDTPSVSPEQLQAAGVHVDEEDVEIPLESNISKTLSERTTKIVIILVLVMLFFQPVFSVGTYVTNPSYADQGLFNLVDLYQTSNWTAYQVTVQQFIAAFSVEAQYPLIVLIIPDYTSKTRTNNTITWTQDPQLEDLRSDEYMASVAYSDDGINFVAFTDQRTNSKMVAILSISRTIFICVILSIASIMFTSDANRLVLTPIERMLEKVKLIAKNPLAAAGDEVDNAGVMTMLQNQEKKSEKDKKEDAQYETAILEKAIVKIGHLLALGFGEAGSKIIASNMSMGGDINPMMAGQRVFAIFGFCDIRNFTDSTEILQTKVMLFVNQIAEITHSMVDKYGGSANKNIGDAFLLVWKFRNEEEFFQTPQVITRDNQYCADLALFSFLKIIAKVNKLAHILEYRKDPELNKRMPGYSVKMGFGLHQGWAIEGAIGSMFKIDASYLSPNVNMASRLEAATKQYGVPLLISGPLHDVFTDKIKMLCREIDTVTVKGSVLPVKFLTVDVDFDNLHETKDKLMGLPVKQKKQARDKKKKLLLGRLFDAGSKVTTWDIFSKDRDFKELRRNYDKVFTKKFNEAYKKYILGDWATAEDLFSQCLKMNPNDGPTITLKSYIEELNGTPPTTWKGFRELTEK